MAFRHYQKNDSQNQNYDSDYYSGKDNGATDDFGYGNAAEQPKAAEQPRQDQRRAPSSGAAYSMKLMKPTSYNDGSYIADALMANNAVIINLENTNEETASNLIYFLVGVTYAIKGHIKQVSASTYMLTPSNMEITEQEQPSQTPPPADGGAPADSGYGYQGYGSGFRG